MNRILIFTATCAALFLGASCTQEEAPSAAGTGDRIGFEIVEQDSDSKSETALQRGAEEQAVSDLLTLQGEQEADSLFLHVSVSDGIALSRIGEGKHETRAAPVTDMAFYEAFGVLGYAYSGGWNETVTPDYMYNAEVREQNGIWSPSTDFYWPGTGRKIRFFAYAPYNGSGISLPARSAEGTPVLTYTVPSEVTDQQDILIAASGELAGNTNSSAPLKFVHALTAVRFVTGDDMLPGKITRITLKGVYGSGSLTMSDMAWNDYGATADFGQIPDGPASDVKDSPITSSEGTFMMIPQTLPDGAAIEITYTDKLTDTPRTLAVSIAGNDWPIGKTLTYRISTSSIVVTPTLTVVAPADFTYQGGTRNYTVTSYATVSRPGEATTTVPMAWTAEFSTDSGITWSSDKPAWLTSFTVSGAGGTMTESFTAAVEAQTGVTGDAHNEALRNAASVTDYNLSNGTGSTAVQNTANCYLVNAPGTYRLPLVYGNAIRNGATNSSAYTSTQSGPNILTNFQNHLDQPITQPYIYDNAGCIPADCSLVWRDEPNLVTNVALSDDGRSLIFEVPQASIKQGNAIVAVRDKDKKIMWSWHIWVTDYRLGDGLKRVTNYQNVQYAFLPINIGWCYDPVTAYAPRQVQVRIKQNESLATQTFAIAQTAHPLGSSGNCTYYQWGRKDPMLPGIYNVGDKGCYTDDDKTDYKFASAPGSITLGEAIQHPHLFYCKGLSNNGWGLDSSYNVWNANNTETTANDNPVVKTIYDPSPAGYCVPPSNAFTGTIYDGSSSYVNGLGKKINSPYISEDERAANFGWVFYCNKMVDRGKFDAGGGTIFYPAVGYRDAASGSVLEIGLDTFCWSAGPSSIDKGRDIILFSEYINANHNSTIRANGEPVRPVREQ